MLACGRPVYICESRWLSLSVFALTPVPLLGVSYVGPSRLGALSVFKM